MNETYNDNKNVSMFVSCKGLYAIVLKSPMRYNNISISGSAYFAFEAPILIKRIIALKYYYLFCILEIYAFDRSAAVSCFYDLFPEKNNPGDCGKIYTESIRKLGN